MGLSIHHRKIPIFFPLKGCEKDIIILRICQKYETWPTTVKYAAFSPLMFLRLFPWKREEVAIPHPPIHKKDPGWQPI